MKKRPRFLRPKLKRQLKDTKSPEDANRKSTISKKNTSRFFTQLYAHLFGGEILEDPWGNGAFNGQRYSFNPDIIWQETERKVYTEVKSCSTNTSILHCRSSQVSANFTKSLEISEEEWPFDTIEHAFFKYGPSSLSVGLQKLSNRALVQKFKGSKKELCVIPINLLLFLSSFSYLDRRNQISSQYPGDIGEYFLVRGGTLTNLLKGTSDFEGLVGNFPSLGLDSKLLALDQIEFERFETPEVHGRYFRDFVVPSFPVARYFIPDERQKEVAETLRENYHKIISKLGLRDLYKPVPF